MDVVVRSHNDMNGESHQQEAIAVLEDFQAELSTKVSEPSAVPAAIERVLDWTNEEPFLTSLICAYVIKYASQVTEEDAEFLVDRIVREEIVLNWETNAAAAHLQKISQTLLDYDRRDSLLILYIKIFQRGKIRPEDSLEQETLLRSGLVEMSRGKLRVKNRLYQDVFDLAWIEQQLPGITRPVSIVTPKSSSSAWARVPLFAKAALALGCLALLATLGMSYWRRANELAMANQDGASVVSLGDVADDAFLSDEPDNLNEPVVIKSDMELFNAGTDHGKNGRWVLMLREFCNIETDSVYYASAQDQLALWDRLYADQLATAFDAVVHEKSLLGKTCSVAVRAE